MSFGAITTSTNGVGSIGMIMMPIEREHEAEGQEDDEAGDDGGRPSSFHRAGS